MARKRIHTVTEAERTAKVYRDTVWAEFIVRLYETDELVQRADYFTDDKQDAIDTAEQMVKPLPKGARQ